MVKGFRAFIKVWNLVEKWGKRYPHGACVIKVSRGHRKLVIM